MVEYLSGGRIQGSSTGVAGSAQDVIINSGTSDISDGSDYIRATKYDSSSLADLLKVTHLSYSASGTVSGDVRLGIYTGTSTTPETLVAQTALFDATSGNDQMIAVETETAFNNSSGYVWIGFSNTATVDMKGSTGVGSAMKYFSNTAGNSFPTTPSGVSNFNTDQARLGMKVIPLVDEKTTITNVPANSRYEEIDTRKIYRMVGDTIATLNHNFASGLSPLTVNSFSSSYISATGGILDCNFPYTTGNSQTNYGVSARYDFGADTVSETNWVLRWKVKCSNFENSGVQFQVGLTDGDDSVYSTATQTSIACLWQQNSSVSLAQGNASSNGLNGSDRTDTGYGLSDNTYYYFEMKRLADDSIGLKVGTSAYGGTEKGNITHTTSSAVDDLRYLTFTKDGRACNADVDEVIFLNNTTSGTVKEWKERGTA